MTKSKAVIEMLQDSGIKFDYTAFYECCVKNKELAQALLADKIKAQLGVKESTLNLDDTKEVIQALYKCNIYPESLSFEYLVKHSTDNEIYKLLLQYKNINQFLHLYRDKLKDQLGKDGRLYPKWKMEGAKTGRITCSEPNIQGFPNSIKEFFVPEEGYVYIMGDYSQLELRVLAEMAKEPNMIRAFKEDRDIHAETAAFIFQKDVSLIDDGERVLGKKINFSQCYGVSSYGLRKILKKQGIEVTQTQADCIRSLFYKKYPNIHRLHDTLLTTDVIRSIGDRSWTNIPKGDVKRLNLPVQASAAEGFKQALDLLVKSLREHPRWKFVNVIHDEILLEVPLAESEKAKDILEKSMIQGMETILKVVPVVVNMKIQNNWKK